MQTNSAGEEGLSALEEVRKGSRRKLEKRLARLAAEADAETPGILDRQAPLRGMPAELKGVRHYRWSRHRVYYEGSNRQCSYRMFHVKIHKKDDVNAEHTSRFQEMLKRDKLRGGDREIEFVDDKDKAAD